MPHIGEIQAKQTHLAIGGAGGAVSSVFGRTGDVTAQAGDYVGLFDASGAAEAAIAAHESDPLAHIASGLMRAYQAQVNAVTMAFGEYTQTVAHAGMTAGKVVTPRLVMLSEDDENGLDELDEMTVAAVPGVDQVTFTLSHVRGPFVGIFNIAYSVA